MKRFLCLTVAVIMALSLCACNARSQLEGNWVITTQADPHAAIEMMRSMSLCDEELSLVATPPNTVTHLQFQKDGSFSCYKDPETEKQCIREFYDEVFDALYQGRHYLNEVYQMDFTDSSKEDFIRFYTDLYSVADYAALIEKFTEAAYDYDSFGQLCSGSYTVKNGIITLDATDDGYDDSVRYTIENDLLTLVTSDATVIFHKKQ